MNNGQVGHFVACRLVLHGSNEYHHRNNEEEQFQCSGVVKSFWLNGETKHIPNTIQ